MSNEEFIHGLVNVMDNISTIKADSQEIKANCNEIESKTDKQIIKMMTENTGVNMLDSGGEYGRSWQRNRDITNWNDIPYGEVTFDFWLNDKGLYKGEWNCDMRLNVFPYLHDHLEYDDDCEYFQKLLDEMWTETDLYLDDFKEWLEDKKGIRLLEGDESYYEGLLNKTDNTYNYEYNILKQCMQFMFIDYNDTQYVIIELHGGCDIRGGYTKPYIFKLTCDDYEFIFDQENGAVRCNKCGKVYYAQEGSFTNDEDYNDKLEMMPYPQKNIMAILKQSYGKPKTINPLKLEGQKLLSSTKGYHKDCGGVLEFY